MTRRQLLQGTALILTAPLGARNERSLAAPPPTRGVALSAGLQPRVTMRRRVTEVDSSPHFWWSICVDPHSSNNVLVSAIMRRPGRASTMNAVLYASKNGGYSWEQVLIDQTSELTSESACAFGGEGGIYMIASSVEGSQQAQPRHAGSRIYYSSDDGRTWQNHFIEDYLDAPAFTVREGPQEQLCIFSNFFFESGPTPRNEPRLTIVEKGGRRLRDVSLPGSRMPCDTCGTARLSDGSVVGLYVEGWSRQGAEIVAYKLDEAISRRIVVGRLSTTVRPQFNILRPSIASGASHSRERLYVAYTDIVNQRSSIFLTSSDDGGQSWTMARRVEEISPIGAAGVEVTHPSLAVNQDGVLGMMWAENHGSKWRFAVMDEEGLFAEAIDIDGEPAEPISLDQRWAGALSVRNSRGGQTFEIQAHQPWVDGGISRGTALAGSGADFVAAWVRRSGPYQGPMMATIRVASRESIERRRRTFSSAHALPGQNSEIWLEYIGLDYDLLRRELSLYARVVHRVAELEGRPVIVCVRQISSNLGGLHAIDTDDSQEGQVGCWVFESQPPSPDQGTLTTSGRRDDRPVFRSRPRELRFRLETDQVHYMFGTEPAVRAHFEFLAL